MNELLVLQINKDSSDRGRPSPYDEEKHIALAYEIFGTGRGVAAFCGEAEICKDTFNEWKRKHKRFKTACNIALNKGEAMWEERPAKMMDIALQTGKALPFNFNYWNAVMRNRYRYYSVSIPRLKDTSSTGRTKATWKALQQGGISPQEFNQISAALMTELKIEELQLQKQAQEHKIPLAVSEATDEAIKAYMIVKSGKGRVVLEEEESND